MAAKKKARKAQPRVQRLDAEWQAFIRSTQEHEPTSEPWADPSTIKPKRRLAKASHTPRKKVRKAAVKKPAARKK